MYRRYKKIFIIGLLVFFTASLFLVGCSTPKEEVAKSQPLSKSNFQLDTVVTISLYNWTDEGTFDRAFDEIRRLENLLSVDKEGSDLDKIWKNGGKAWTAVSPETLEVIKSSLAYSELSQGYFDISTGPLISLWNIQDGQGHYPSNEELAVAKAQTGYQRILINDDGEVMLQDPGMKANLGAIAKGYIADKVKELLVGEGVKSGIINLGGNVLVIGENPNGEPFHIGIQDPHKKTGEVLGSIDARNISLVSSGINERYFEYEGKRYHHILDPFTGFPSEKGIAGVTILSEKSMDGDALSTTVFLLGIEKGMALIESLPNKEAIIVDNEGKLHCTKGAEELLNL
ncbi:MAG: FAD:protein FMN transferase [Anaerovorax sp.]